MITRRDEMYEERDNFKKDIRRELNRIVGKPGHDTFFNAGNDLLINEDKLKLSNVELMQIRNVVRAIAEDLQTANHHKELLICLNFEASER